MRNVPLLPVHLETFEAINEPTAFAIGSEGGQAPSKGKSTCEAEESPLGDASEPSSEVQSARSCRSMVVRAARGDRERHAPREP